MQTMTKYPGYPRCGWILLRALAGAGAVVGLVAALADAAVAAPTASVTITERTAAAAAQTAKAPKVLGDVKPSTFILDTAALRLREHAQKATVSKVAGARIVAKAPLAAPLAAKIGPAVPHVAAKPAAHPGVRLAQADTTAGPTAVTAEFGDLKTAPAATDQRVRQFGSRGGAAVAPSALPHAEAGRVAGPGLPLGLARWRSATRRSRTWWPSATTRCW